MGERYPARRLSFNRSIHVEARSEALSSDGGALLLRDGLERLGAIEVLLPSQCGHGASY